MKRLCNRRLLRQLQAIGLILAVFLVPLSGHTLTVLLWLGALLVAWVPSWNRLRVVLPIWAAMLGSVLLPIDISFLNRPGPPHFAPLVMGLPGPKLTAKARRGEVVLGGCVSTGFEPKWVWVW